MKGIYIFEESFLKDAVACLKLNNIAQMFKCESGESFTEEVDLHALVEGIGTKSRCNKSDTYDFETGALIALMKMCGFDKSYKAIEEAFKYNSYDVKKTKELEEENFKAVKNIVTKKIELEKEIKCLKIKNKYFTEDINRKFEYMTELKRSNDVLKEENEKLKLDCDKYFKAVKNIVTKKIELEKENDRLKEKNTELIEGNSALVAAREHLLNESMHRLRDKIDLKEKYVALKAENEKLKLDCEKLQHGYLDTDMIFCGGRQNGKQYTFLVELFKKLDQKKVDAAYKEAYEVRDYCCNDVNVTEEVFNHFAGDKERLVKWIKPPTKREVMWDEIFELHKKDDVIIKVKREDVNTFLHEIEDRFPEITWASGVKIFETKYTIDDIYAGLKLRDVVYFRLRKENKLSYSGDPDIYPFKDLKRIDYLPPMRWDLFKEGRIVVACTEEEVPEFREKVVRELGNVRMEKYSVENLHCNGPIKVYFHYDKDTNWLKPLLVSGIPHVKVNNHKVYYWEDVR